MTARADSPNHPTLIGPIRANAPERAQFRGPDRRYLAWDFSAEQQVPVSIRSKIEARPTAGTFVQVLWQPSCTDPWRTVDIAAGTLSRDLSTAGGHYLLVSGPRATNTSGTLEATLAVTPEEATLIVGPRCRPGTGDRPPVPEALDPEPTVAVGSIGARFAVTQGGTASYSVPIVTPPGRAGIEPRLAVTYDSGGGNGILGTRFGLSGLSRITRCHREVVHDGRHEPPALKDSDAYCIDGVRLVPSGSGPGGQIWYATESESYARISPVGAGPGGPESFKVEAKDGRILEYGTSDDSRMFAKLMPSDGANVIRTWALKRVSDRSGNWMECTYEKTWELRVASIVYTGSSVAPALLPNREVRFKYRARKDVQTGWYLGQQVGRDSLLETITIFGPSPTASGAHGVVGELGLRSYSFGYREADRGHTTEYPDSQTRLTSITECGRIQQRPSGSSETGCKPPTRFDWNDNGMAPGFAGPQQQTRVRQDVSGWPADRRPLAGLFDASGRLSRWGMLGSLEGPKGLVLPIDLDGDGRTDILYPAAAMASTESEAALRQVSRADRRSDGC